MSKQDLRQDALAMRRSYARALWPTTRSALEKQLAQIVLPHLLTSRVIAFYHPMKDEISPYPIMEGLTDGQIALLPWFANRDARMIWRQAPATEVGPWGMLQPPAEAEAMAPDTVIVPLVLGDRKGSRIGHGKGHYDRALSHLRISGLVRTVGIAWDIQISDDLLDPDPWDVPLDAIATPGEWIQCA